jgi:hypothetical protein
MFGKWLTLAFAFCLLGPGCKPEPDPTGGGGGGGGLGAHVQRGKEKRSLENDIRQLGLFIQQFETQEGHLPKSWEEFKPFLKGDGSRIAKEIEDRQIIVLFGSPWNSNTIYAYELEPDIRKSHVVLYGGGAVVTVPTDQLRSALQKQGVK